MEPIEHQYLRWLCAKVLDERLRQEAPAPSTSYDNLMQYLHTTEFVFTIIGDDNRAEDGLGLRREFAQELGVRPEDIWSHQPCSVLEMLIALSRRAEFQTDTESRWWFWKMLQNLGLDEYSDAKPVDEFVSETLERLVWRQYNHKGEGGGLFPMQDPPSDLRTVELYYQFVYYLTANHWQF